MLQKPPTLLGQKSLIEGNNILKPHTTTALWLTVFPVWPMDLSTIFRTSPPKSSHHCLEFLAKRRGELKHTHGIRSRSLCYCSAEHFTTSHREDLALPRLQLIRNPLLNATKTTLPVFTNKRGQTQIFIMISNLP